MDQENADADLSEQNNDAPLAIPEDGPPTPELGLDDVPPNAEEVPDNNEQLGANFRGPDVGSRMATEIFIKLPNGRVSFYPTRNNFEAVCKVHHRCVLTRTCNAKSGAGSETKGGRPLGFLCGWLDIANMFDTKEQHMSKNMWQRELTQEVRMQHRAQLCLTTEGMELLGCERMLASEEAEEPTTLVGYV